MARLESVTWTGRGGKGTWSFDGSSGVHFTHACVAHLDTWLLCQGAAPVYNFEDQDVAQVLGLPPPPVNVASADFPALTRSTTNSSSRTSLHTPVPASPVSCQRPSVETSPSRRSSIVSPNHKVTSTFEGLTLNLDKQTSKSRRHSLPAVSVTSRHRSHTIDISRTPKTPRSASERFGHSQTLSSVRNTSNETPEKEIKSRKSKEPVGIFDDLSRHVPGSGRPAQPLVAPKVKPPKPKIMDPIIVEADEDGWEQHDLLHDSGEVGGWTTVSKEKPKDKVRVSEVRTVSKSRKGRK